MDPDLERSESQGNLQKIRDRTKSVGDVPKQLFIPFSSRFQVSSSFKFHVFLLLQLFLNVCYFTFITPLRFTKISKKRYAIRTNPLQQVLSTLVIVTSIIYALLDLRYWVEQSLKQNPHKAFQYASYLIRGFIPLFWFGTFWLKRKWFDKLLVVCQGRKEQCNNPLLGFKSPKQRKLVKPSLKIRLIVAILLVLTLAKIAFQIYSWHLNDLKWKKLIAYNTHVALYNLHLRTWNNYTEYEDIEHDTALLCTGWITTVFSLLDVYLENMFDLLCFIGAAMVYAVCGHFSDEMEKLSQLSSSANANEYLQSKKILKLMQTNYVDLIAILESINEMFGTLIVLYFLRSYPNLVWSVFGLFRKVHLDMAIFYAHKIGVFILVTMTAAEGNAKVQQFKQWLFHTSVAASTSGHQEDDDDYSLVISINEFNAKTNEDFGRGHSVSAGIDMSSLNVLHREVSTERLGLKGYKFFTVTHDLTGTILGIVVTYAIVMLQFEMDVEENQRSTGGSHNKTIIHTQSTPTEYEFPDDLSNVTDVPLLFT